jgi:hypothetical protein
MQSNNVAGPTSATTTAAIAAQAGAPAAQPCGEQLQQQGCSKQPAGAGGGRKRVRREEEQGRAADEWQQGAQPVEEDELLCQFLQLQEFLDVGDELLASPASDGSSGTCHYRGESPPHKRSCISMAALY